uniref:snRNA-activating protein complex subunit 4 n=1 Tax=Phasianus colchicus TaxID=9054 RepID=A0A669QDE6_PHACC
SDDDLESSLLEDPETCLQMNYVYQEVIQEKIEEVELLIAQNKEQQKEILCELDGRKTAKTGDGRNLPSNIFLGHFMKPYFKDKTTGIGPPSNEDAKEKAAQGIKSFEQLLSTKLMLKMSLNRLSYSNQKLENVKTEMEKQILEKQIKEVEREIEAINQLPESDLLGGRFDEHDWEKISNIHFDGRRSSDELKKFWQNWEHPSINKNEWTEEETERLKDIAAKHGYLDWQTVAQELGTNRTAFQCLQKYQAYNKDLKRKEWTKDEDKMLLELVQEMRVGSHIPYKKIAYYMEGRDSAQLIYRWTKSVDPSLKKGPWTPEEDAMLLAAVEKYGERDWYKIRTEVPGRSDAQCSDRYLKALHRDVKKGKWSLKEEEQLIDLVQKHGLGHWSKIAAELPHRTRSQCLSKWKIMIGSRLLKFFLSEDLFFFPLIHLIGNASQPAPKRQTAPPALPSFPAPLAQAQRQKPKTVSELLREKRQMEKQLKEKAMQTKVFVAPQMMLSGPLIIQHPPQQMIPSAQVGTFTSVAGSASTPVVLENRSPSVSKVGESPSSSQETKVQFNKELNEQAPQNTPERGVFPSLNPAAAGKAPNQGVFTVVPFGIESGNSKLSLPPPVTYELNRPGPVNLLPALLAPQPGSHLTPDSVLPLTWIVTQQALLSSAVQAVVGVPQSLQAAIVRSQSQASVTSSGNVCGLGAPLVSSGVNMPHPSHAETKTNPQLASGSPAGKTADVSHSASVFPVSSANPVCSISGVSSALSAHSDSSSKTVDSSAAQNALPGGAPTPHAHLLPQMQLPASQGSDSHSVTGDVGLGESQDSSTTNGSSSNSNVLNEGEPGASIPHDSVAGNSEGSADQALKYRPIASKAPPAQAASAPPQPTTSSAEKTLLDYSLISLEDEELVKEWLSGKQGVQVPPLQTRLPYFPPFLCNLKTLSKLLLQKAALEKQAARLLSPDGSQTEDEVDLNAITELVHEKLGDDPAFLLLKARFLAAFTLPAVLATLPPPKVATTLSASRREYGESDEEEWQSEEAASENESCGDELDAQSDGTGDEEPGDQDADSPNKVKES